MVSSTLTREEEARFAETASLSLLKYAMETTWETRPVRVRDLMAVPWPAVVIASPLIPQAVLPLARSAETVSLSLPKFATEPTWVARPVRVKDLMAAPLLAVKTVFPLIPQAVRPLVRSAETVSLRLPNFATEPTWVARPVRVRDLMAVPWPAVVTASPLIPQAALPLVRSAETVSLRLPKYVMEQTWVTRPVRARDSIAVPWPAVVIASPLTLQAALPLVRSAETASKMVMRNATETIWVEKPAKASVLVVEC
jgi:hypothetical protein